MPVDNPLNGALDVTLDGAFDGVSHIGGIPVPQGGLPIVADDFDRASLGSDWTVTDGTSSDAVITTTKVQAGSGALEVTVPTDQSTNVRASGTLPRYPQPGEAVEWYWSHDGSLNNTYDFRVGAGGIPSSGRYLDVQIQDRGDSLVLRSHNGSLASVSVTEPEGSYYRGYLQIGESGDHTAKVFGTGGSELGSVTGTETDIPSTFDEIDLGGSPISGSTSGTVYYDEIRVMEP